ncbi:MAG: cupin domain-containing protein [Alphaproteobacteria bacterium]|nr:cupin domain-containing protein [Alphaproteobacteria bacterium]
MVRRNQADLDAETLSRIAEAEQEVHSFSYAKPDKVGSGKAIVRLGKGGRVRGLVQLVRDGGENNLHYHTDSDSLWYVLKGRVRFYGAGDKVLGEFGPNQGIITPSYFRYWFERVGDEDLELLQVGALSAPDVESSGRTDLEPQKTKLAEHARYSAAADAK